MENTGTYVISIVEGVDTEPRLVMVLPNGTSLSAQRKSLQELLEIAKKSIEQYKAGKI